MTGGMLLLGIFIFVFTSGFVRFYLGDVVVVMFLYSLYSIFSQKTPLRKMYSVFTFAVIIEVIQILPISYYLPSSLLIFTGANFDPRDFIAYAIGLALIYFYDVQSQKRIKEENL